MLWDKDNPPAEFWGSDIEFGSAEWAILPPEQQARAHRIEFAAVLVVGAAITFFGALWHLGLFVVVVVALDWARLHFFSRAPGTAHALYYQCFRDGFRVRADVTGPNSLKGAMLRLSETRTTRFTQDDVRTLAVSRQTKRFPPVRTDVPVVQLVFTLHDGTEFRHAQLLHTENPIQLHSDLREFLALLGRLEAILGPDRIENAESLNRARDALQQKLQEPRQPEKATGTGIA